jgi:hypothetical protein
MNPSSHLASWSLLQSICEEFGAVMTFDQLKVSVAVRDPNYEGDLVYYTVWQANTNFIANVSPDLLAKKLTEVLVRDIMDSMSSQKKPRFSSLTTFSTSFKQILEQLGVILLIRHDSYFSMVDFVRKQDGKKIMSLSAGTLVIKSIPDISLLLERALRRLDD